LPKHQGVGWAGFHASGFLSFLQSLVTHVALHDSRIPAGILEFRDIERTGDHAKSASHALVAIPGDGSLFGLEHCIYKTGSRAGWLPAMQALLFDEYFPFRGLETIYNRKLLVTRVSDLFKCIVAFYIRNIITMRLRTGHLAGPAADAPGCIDEYPDEFFGFYRAVSLQIVVGYASCSNGRRGN
jgi:hypothetical protein